MVTGATAFQIKKGCTQHTENHIYSQPCTLEDVREGTKWIKRRHGGTPLDSYYVADEIQLEENTFFNLCDSLLGYRDWVEAFSNRDYPMRDGAVVAIRVTCAHLLTVLIIACRTSITRATSGSAKLLNKVPPGTYTA